MSVIKAYLAERNEIKKREKIVFFQVLWFNNWIKQNKCFKIKNKVSFSCNIKGTKSQLVHKHNLIIIWNI